MLLENNQTMKKTQEEINKEFNQRIELLEKAVASVNSSPRGASGGKGKAVSLAELVKKHNLSNGQEKIAAIVGYLEKVRGRNDIAATDIKQGWREGKFDGGFANVLVTRAVKDGYINDYDGKGTYTLTQTGEKFWDTLNS